MRRVGVGMDAEEIGRRRERTERVRVERNLNVTVYVNVQGKL